MKKRKIDTENVGMNAVGSVIQLLWKYSYTASFTVSYLLW